MTSRRDELLKGCGFEGYGDNYASLGFPKCEQGNLCNDCKARLDEHDKTMAWVMEQIDKWANEEFFGGELGDKDSDEFETSIGSMRNSIKQLKQSLAQSPHDAPSEATIEDAAEFAKASKAYRNVLKHRRGCQKWGKGFCLKCFGGGLTQFTKDLSLERISSQSPHDEVQGASSTETTPATSARGADSRSDKEWEDMHQQNKELLDKDYAKEDESVGGKNA